jgi:uncharacterized protein YqjF (DUF2071 family)
MAFLTARWLDLLFVNWELDPALLRARIPLGTELDSWEGKHYVSLVAFRFSDTRVLALKIPFHVNFEEVNLRFYVRRVVGSEVRRGVVFIREIVPRQAIALVARWLYNEPYISLPMSHDIDHGSQPLDVTYGWKSRSGASSLRSVISAPLTDMRVGSHEEFIAEHYWGYTPQRDGGSLEYQVKHPRWQVGQVAKFEMSVQFADFYPPELLPVLQSRPASVFYAPGSEVSVDFGSRISARGS